MNPVTKAGLVILCLGAFVLRPYLAGAAEFRYMRVGNPKDAPAAATKAGFAVMGGGDELDEAFRWLCDRAGEGDILVLRATSNDEYNAYIQRLCHVNSVATLMIPSRAAATDPEVAKIIAHASAIFISGGDQANYINYWMGTPVQTALNDAICRGVPIGGTSAGVAVMGEWAYSAQADKPDDPNLDSKAVLRDLSNRRITLVHGFLEIPILRGVITDTHFTRRNRMGRLLVFLARLNEPDGKVEPPPVEPQVRAIGVDEGTAVLLDPDGSAKVIGRGSGAYFVDRIDNAHFNDLHNRSLYLSGVRIHRVAPGHEFNVKTWSGDATSYTLSARKGRLYSNQPDGAVY